MLANTKALPDDWHWQLFVPSMGDGEPWKDVDNVSVWRLDWADNVLQSRYFLDYPELVKAIEQFKPEIMICEQPEHARAIRVAQAATGVDFPIVSFWTHVDINRVNVHSDTDPIFRQIDGFMASDEIAFQSNEEMTTWFTGAEKLLSGSLDRSKASVWSGIFDTTELDSCRIAHDPDLTPAIFFVSRLSDNPRTRWEEFAQATRKLQKKGLCFRTWIANPNEALTRAEIEERFANLEIVGPMTRDQYLMSLWQADIVPILYSNGSVSFCEAAYADNLIVTSSNRQGATSSGMFVVKQNPTSSDIANALETALRCVGTDRAAKRMAQTQAATLARHGTMENAYQIHDSFDAAFRRHEQRRRDQPLKRIEGK
jgi:hypothetical protein